MEARPALVPRNANQHDGWCIDGSSDPMDQIVHVALLFSEPRRVKVVETRW